jgi:glycerate 2-kinase
MTLVSDALAIARQGIRAVDPAVAVRRALRRDRSGVRIGARALRPGPGGSVHLVALGKAAGAMADAATPFADSRRRGIVVTPRGYPPPRSPLRVVFGDHPVPRFASFRAGEALLEYVRGLRPGDAALFLISGGGSAVAEVAPGEIRPEDLTRTTELLLGSGAPIEAMNALRRHLSAIKGGQLARAVVSGRVATLAISDVVGDAPENIASGPTVGDPTTFADAVAAARRYSIWDRLPARVRRHLEAGARGAIPETPKPRETSLRHAPFLRVATNRIALQAAAREARRRGYRPELLSTRVTGETQPVARAFARRLRRAASARRPRAVALLSGGETTVTLGPHPGRGGRNQEFALAAAPLLDRANALVLSVGTDGIDGPTDAAGGWSDGRTLVRAAALHLDLRAALASHSAYDALERLGSLVRTGPTGTNVMDLHVGLARPTGGRPFQSRYGRK